ncbi:MAG: ion transporter [Planctomycetota bacterium]|nr:ion transporter [Planctomycetota bacterium]
MTNQSSGEEPKTASWQRSLRRFFIRPDVELCIAILILLSVALTLIELALEGSGVSADRPQLFYVMLFNQLLTSFFVIELTLRFFSASSKWKFWREYWLDVLSVLPLFRVFRVFRILRLLRLFRVMRVLGIATRLASRYPEVFRRGMVEYFVVCGLLVTTVIFGTVGLMFAENSSSKISSPEITGSLSKESIEGENSEINERLNLEKAFWFSVYSLFAGEPIPEAPKTVEGKVVTVFIMFMGLTIFAMFTGTVSAFMIERFKSEGMVVASEDLEDHVVICGWNSKTEVIIREYRASASLKRVQIAVISEQEIDEAGVPEDLRNQISFIQDDFTRISALERAGISRAKTCIILADMGSGRSEQDADARTILAALTVEKISPQVYTCAELLNRQYGSHLSMGHVNDYVVSGDYSAYLLAQSSMNRGLMGVVGELLTYQHGQEFYRQPILPEWEGMSFSDLLLLLRNEHGAILVAVHTTEGAQKVNPKDHVFGEGDEIVIISDREID